MISNNQEQAVIVRDAAISDAPALSGLAFRSKSHWGYPAEFMEMCRKELEVTAEHIAAARMNFGIAEKGSEILGYYALRKITRNNVELEALFVEPSKIGSGIGLLLLNHAKARAAEEGARIITVQSDPNASGFYLKAGAKNCGERISASIPGRLLPMFEFKLEAGG